MSGVIYPRPSKGQYLMEMAVLASLRGTCDRRHVGCVIGTSDGHLLSTGYNGSLPGEPHCDEAGHLMFKDSCVRTVHAEANAVAHAARRGLNLYGSIAYCTCHPCIECMKLMLSAGVMKVLYLEPYHKGSDDVLSQLISDYDERVVHFEKVMKRWIRS